MVGGSPLSHIAWVRRARRDFFTMPSAPPPTSNGRCPSRGPILSPEPETTFIWHSHGRRRLAAFRRSPFFARPCCRSCADAGGWRRYWSSSEVASSPRFTTPRIRKGSPTLAVKHRSCSGSPPAQRQRFGALAQAEPRILRRRCNAAIASGTTPRQTTRYASMSSVLLCARWNRVCGRPIAAKLPLPALVEPGEQ